MGFGLELEIKNVKLRNNVRIERSGKTAKIAPSPFPFREIFVIDDNTIKGKLLARFSNLDGITPNLHSILRALRAIAEFEKVSIKVGDFYKLDIDTRLGIVVATGLADMRQKNFKLQDIERLELGKIWRKIYEF